MFYVFTVVAFEYLFYDVVAYIKNIFLRRRTALRVRHFAYDIVAHFELNMFYGVVTHILF